MRLTLKSDIHSFNVLTFCNHTLPIYILAFIQKAPTELTTSAAAMLPSGGKNARETLVFE